MRPALLLIGTGNSLRGGKGGILTLVADAVFAELEPGAGVVELGAAPGRLST